MNKILLLLLWSFVAACSDTPPNHVYVVEDNLHIKYEVTEFVNPVDLLHLGSPKWYVGDEKVLCVCCEKDPFQLSVNNGILIAYCKDHALVRDQIENQ